MDRTKRRLVSVTSMIIRLDCHGRQIASLAMTKGNEDDEADPSSSSIALNGHDGAWPSLFIFSLEGHAPSWPLRSTNYKFIVIQRRRRRNLYLYCVCMVKVILIEVFVFTYRKLHFMNFLATCLHLVLENINSRF